jgi:ferredoxin
MAHFQVNDKCNGCLACVQNCPASALDSVDKDEKRTLLHNIARCARCGTCWRICPQDAVEFKHLLKSDWDEVATLNLVGCKVCGETLYTKDFGETLSEKLHTKVDSLCPKHREELSRLASVYFFPGKSRMKMGEKR